MARFGRGQPFRPQIIRPDLGPVYFDNQSSSGYNAALSTYSFTHTVGTNNNRLLIVGVSLFAIGSVTGITYNGVALTKVRHDATGIYRSEVWSLVAPASGSNTVQVTLSASLTSIAGAASYRNVDQAEPIEANNGATGTNNPASVSVTPISAYTRVFGNLAAQTASGISDSAGQVPRYVNSGALGTQASAERGTVMGITTTSLSWNGLGALDSWAASAVVINPALPSIVYYLTFIDIATTSDSMAKLITKVFSETVASSETFQKAITKVLNDTSTATDSIAKFVTRILTDVSTTSDSITKLVTKLLTDVSTTSDSITKLVTKVLTDTLSISEIFSKIVAKLWSRAPQDYQAMDNKPLDTQAKSTSPIGKASDKSPNGV